jgi:hypothetical protein
LDEFQIFPIIYTKFYSESLEEKVHLPDKITDRKIILKFISYSVARLALVDTLMYEGNSKRKVPYFISAESVPAFSWFMGSVSTYIHHQIAVRHHLR